MLHLFLLTHAQIACDYSQRKNRNASYLNVYPNGEEVWVDALVSVGAWRRSPVRGGGGKVYPGTVIDEIFLMSESKVKKSII